jgi:hypothetical protein
MESYAVLPSATRSGAQLLEETDLRLSEIAGRVGYRSELTRIVRRVSRDSLAASPHQTKVAIDGSVAHCKPEH